MENAHNQESVLVIAGMHRSGTSLATALLQSAGLDIGQRLMAGDHVNVKGHFENLDFVDFHKTVLQSQQLHPDGWSLQEQIEIEEQYIDAAKELVAKNSVNAIWGWKDPRTTLFLNFWAEILPDAKFILLYRLPWEVADSLYRRGDTIFQLYPHLAVKAWIHYNKLVVDFYDKFSDRCCLVSVYNLSRNPQSFINTINEKFQLNLGACTTEIYDASMLNMKVSMAHRPTLINHYFPEALHIYQELNTREVRLELEQKESWLEKIKSFPYKVWAFQDWVDVRNLEKHSRTLQAELELKHQELELKHQELELKHQELELKHQELELKHQELEQTRAEVQHLIEQANLSQSQLEQTRAEFDRSQAQMQQTQAELEQSIQQANQFQAQLQLTKTELERLAQQADISHSHLELAEAKVQQAEATIAWMHTSKFWKLREQWIKIKKLIT